jgi:ribosome-associated heat shock protein Hsp15
MAPEPQAQTLRADLWLWHARFFKTRALAAEMVSKKKIRLTHQGRQVRLDKPSRTVHVGDEITFTLGGRITHVRVLKIGERRGPAPEARTLYDDLSPLDQAQPVERWDGDRSGRGHL